MVTLWPSKTREDDVLKKRFIVVLATGCFLSVSLLAPAFGGQEKPKAGPDLVALLEKSGYSLSLIHI